MRLCLALARLSVAAVWLFFAVVIVWVEPVGLLTIPFAWCALVNIILAICCLCDPDGRGVQMRLCMAMTRSAVAAGWSIGIILCASDEQMSVPWLLGVLFAWFALAYIILAICYLCNPELGVCLLAKNTDTGQMNWWCWWLAPYLFGLWFYWWVKHTLRRQHPYDLVADGIYVGRVCMRYPSEFPVECTHVVDLTAEFPVRKKILQGRTLRCLPSLDRAMPAEQSLGLLAREIVDWGGLTYIQCANGHSRSAVLAAMVLVLRGQCDTVAEGICMLQSQRSVVSCQPYQVSTGQNALQYARKMKGSTPRSASAVKLLIDDICG